MTNKPESKTAREILEDNHARHPYIYDVMDVDKALSDLADLILAEKEILSGYDKNSGFMRSPRYWNAACEHLAKKIREER